jgi:hypothetical protein
MIYFLTTPSPRPRLRRWLGATICLRCVAQGQTRVIQINWDDHVLVIDVSPPYFLEIRITISTSSYSHSLNHCAVVQLLVN